MVDHNMDFAAGGGLILHFGTLPREFLVAERRVQIRHRNREHPAGSLHVFFETDIRGGGGEGQGKFPFRHPRSLPRSPQRRNVAGKILFR
jgi:hypothetical protein